MQGERERATLSYEIRLLNRDGGTALLYFAQCASDGDAKARVSNIKDARYDRYELWQGSRKVGEGPCLTDGPRNGGIPSD
jgi:hypothetical protein